MSPAPLPDPSPRQRYARLLDVAEPYLVASPLGARASAAASELGLERVHHIDPHRVASSEFLSLVQRLDRLTYGQLGMIMPRWVLYDCVEVPGGIFGFAIEAGRLPPWVRELLRAEPGYHGLVPISMLIAIPMLAPGVWHTYALCSVNQIAPGAAPAGLRKLTQAVGLTMLDVRQAYGATQWRSAELPIHARFAPLELLTAWTPAHNEPATLTYRFDVSPERVHDALGDEPRVALDEAGVRWVDCDDPAALQQLQAELESGRQYAVVGPPRVRGSWVHMPLREVTT